MVVENMIGKKYGRLTVVDQYYKDTGEKLGTRRDFCLCDCDCGTKNYEAMGKNIRRGMTVSCGCCHREAIWDACHKVNDYWFDGSIGYGKFSNDDDFFIFDTEDYDKIKNYCWAKDMHGYAFTNIEGNHLTLQNLIMDNHNKEIREDHINRKRNDNRKENLRPSTHQENNINRSISSANTSGIIGISKTKSGSYHAYLAINGKRVLNKRFNNLEEAIKARLIAEKEYFKEFSPQSHLFEKYGV